jgi:hypothetical protein
MSYILYCVNPKNDMSYILYCVNPKNDMSYILYETCKTE